MPAETAAAAPGVTGAPESQVETTESSAAQPATGSEATREASAETADATAPGSDRLRAILEEEGLPDDEVAELTKPKGKPNAKATETPDSDRTQEEVRNREPGKGPTDKGPTDKGPGQGEEEVTDAEKKTWPKEAVDRIHKATAQREAARKEAAQLREQLQRTSRATRPAPTAGDPLADVETPQQMRSAIAEYEQLLEWAELNPDGLTDVEVGKDAQGKPILRDYSAQEMAKIRASSGKILRQAVPQKIALLREQGLHEQHAREAMPEMFEEGTEANRFYQAARTEVPGITNLPGYANWIRWAWMGREQDIKANAEAGTRNGESGKNGKTVDPKVAPFLLKHPPQAPGAPEVRVPTGDETRSKRAAPAEVTKATERVQAGEGEEAEVDLIESLRNGQSPAKRGAVLV